MTEVTGVLVKCNECRAVVRLDRPERDVEFTDQEGQPRRFHCRSTQVTTWAPTTVVEPVGFEPLENEENDMSKTTANAKKPQGAKMKAIEKTLTNHPDSAATIEGVGRK